MTTNYLYFDSLSKRKQTVTFFCTQLGKSTFNKMEEKLIVESTVSQFSTEATQTLIE